MFQLSKYRKLEAFQKTGYVAKALELTLDDLGDILELETDAVEFAFETGHIPADLSNPDSAFEHLYLLTMLFGYILRMADYETEALRDLWENTTIYDSAIVKPPWYEKGLKNYLFDGKSRAVELCVKWTREY